MERLLTTSVERDGAEPVLLCSNTYDDLGRLATQSLGGTAEGNHVESLTYSYNVRGWTTGITGTNFSQTLHYEDTGDTGATECYNGNISSVEWTARETIETDTLINNRYNYKYNNLNRLVEAAYSAPGARPRNGKYLVGSASPRDYSASYSYDLNGNVTTLTRKGIKSVTRSRGLNMLSFNYIDDLSLEYNGNQLKKVTDQCDDLTYEGAMDFKDGTQNTTEYTYDANGNMTSDRNKGIHNITYNVLNLPQSVIFDDGHETRYTYAADGRKLRVEYILTNSRFLEPTEPIIGGGISLFSGGLIDDVIDVPLDTAIIMPAEQTLMVRDYCGNHIYRNGALERVLNAVGYADSIGYHYQVKDYRGDVRAVVTQNGALEETNSYYPYGVLHGTSAIASTQPYKYTGKELDRENGLDWYDFEARMLMSDLGRTTTMDPLAEKYYSISPYVWCAGNPILLVDPIGQYLVGTDSLSVSYNENTNIWSDNADYSIKFVGNVMIRTNTGKAVLKDMMEAPYPISIKLVNLANSDSNSIQNLAGSTETNVIESKDGKEIQSVNILLFNNVISEKMVNDSMYKDSGLSLYDIIGTIAVHEGTHATKKEANRKFTDEVIAERKASEVEKKAVEELKKRKHK